MLQLSFREWDWQTCSSWSLVATLFVIPLSPTLKSIFAPLAMVGILLTMTQKRDVLFVLSQPWCQAGLALFFLTAIACLWSPAAPHLRLVFIEKYTKLLYLPVFAMGFQNPNIRRMGLYAFLAAMLLTCVLSLLKTKGDLGSVFHNHIVTSYMMALAAYCAGWFTVQVTGIKRAIPLALLGLFSYQLLCVNTGRSGQVLYCVMMVMLFFQYFSFKQAMAVLVCFFSLGAVLCYQSHALWMRWDSVLQEIYLYQQGIIETSVGLRLSFYSHAKTLFLSSPWFGHGTGGFAHTFQIKNALPDWQHLIDPHSQYWLVASDLGLLGLIVLACFFASLFWAASALETMKPVMLGLLVSFLLGNLSDSLLLYSAVGYLFILLSALCLGELLEQRIGRRSSELNKASWRADRVCPT